MKRTFFHWIIFFIGFNTSIFGQQAKYVFYFIGDGMGLNQVNGTEIYLAAQENRIGITPLRFTRFPYVSFATTYSASNDVTDSAASGTALATGHKTKNGTIGMLADLKTPVTSIAVWAKEAGTRVGIASSVSLDHATPASFYAHVAKRSDYYTIGKQLFQAGFDFYAGSDFLKPNGKQGDISLYKIGESAGYTFVRGYNEYLSKASNADKLILLQSEEASHKDRTAIPYAIDREGGELTLTEITHAGIDFLSKDLSKGFFFMVEGGKIDWACHANDGATVFEEIIDFDNAIQVAYEFYLKHPHETLIIVTADHETGGLSLCIGKHNHRMKLLKQQKNSVNKFSQHLNNLRRTTGNNVTWEQVNNELQEYFSFGDSIKLNDNQKERLHKCFEESFLNQHIITDESLYQKDERLASVAKEIINEISQIKWSTGSHTSAYVPVFAIGVGANMFTGLTDNAEIPLKIAKVAEWMNNTNQSCKE